MRKFSSYLLVSFIILFQSGCGDKSSDHRLKASLDGKIAVIDTLNKLDSLVNAYKVSDKALAKQYGKRALSFAFRFDSEEMLAHAFLINLLWALFMPFLYLCITIMYNREDRIPVIRNFNFGVYAFYC